MFWMQNMLKVFNILIQVDLLIFLFIRLFLRILDFFVENVHFFMKIFKQNLHMHKLSK